MRAFFKGAVCLLCVVAQAGCMTGADHQQSLHASQEAELTVGIVQREIAIGMSGAEVAESLGSPNIVTKDGSGNETWIYDKIATEASYSRDQGSVAGAGLASPGSTLFLAVLTGNYSRSAGASSVTQKTLTVVIHFDDAMDVSKFSYHSSKF